MEPLFVRMQAVSCLSLRSIMNLKVAGWPVVPVFVVRKGHGVGPFPLDRLDVAQSV
jgi:hypothetical protein